jgi:hypothetical protein
MCFAMLLPVESGVPRRFASEAPSGPSQADDSWTLSDFKSAADPCDMAIDDLLVPSATEYVLVGDSAVPHDSTTPLRVTRRYEALGMTEVVRGLTPNCDAEVLKSSTPVEGRDGSARGPSDSPARKPAGQPMEGAVVLPLLAKSAARRRVAIGIDYLVRVARLHMAGGDPELFGGREPGDRLGYPVLTGGPGRWGIELDERLDWPAPPIVLPVINISVGPPTPRMPAVDNDIGLLAIRLAAAQNILMVLAAGNCGQLGADSMQAWARPAYVLAVGATDDAAGRDLADYSGRGLPGDSASGPDLVAHGVSDLDSYTRGTSFAAPHVTFCALLIAAALLQLRRELLVAQGQPPFGVPLVGAGIVDRFGARIWGIGSRALRINALPIAGVSAQAVASAHAAATKAGITLSVTSSSALLRSLLIRFARPVPGYGMHEVGAGFIDVRLVIEGLTRLTAADLLAWQQPAGQQTLPDTVRAQLEGITLFDPVTLPVLATLVDLSAVRFVYDRDTQRAAISPCPEGWRNQMPLDTKINGIKVP